MGFSDRKIQGLCENGKILVKKLPNETVLRTKTLRFLKMGIDKTLQLFREQMGFRTNGILESNSLTQKRKWDPICSRAYCMSVLCLAIILYNRCCFTSLKHISTNSTKEIIDIGCVKNLYSSFPTMISCWNTPDWAYSTCHGRQQCTHLQRIGLVPDSAWDDTLPLCSVGNCCMFSHKIPWNLVQRHAV